MSWADTNRHKRDLDVRSKRHRLHLAASKTHKWLALIIGAQLLIWFASGALMSFLPIKEIHGDHLVDRETVASLPTAAKYADPALYLGRNGSAAEKVTLRMLHGRAVAEVASGESIRMFDAQTGEPLPPVDAALASAIARQAWRGATLPAGDIHAWIGCESAAAKALRAHLVGERGLNPKWVRASGYWRRGSAATHDTHED